MIKIIHGDLFDTEAEYICHQVNCQGVMGSGVAKQVKEKYPNVFDEYAKWCRDVVLSPLGSAQMVECDDGKTIINLFAQDKYGRDKKYTDYFAFACGLVCIKMFIPKGSTIAMPYGIGCGLGGGDWDVILEMIGSALGRDFIVELWKK